METSLSEDNRRKLDFFWGRSPVILAILFISIFFLAAFLLKIKLTLVDSILTTSENEVFGFAPYWSLSKLDNVDWDTLTTFAYFSIPVNWDGSLDKTSWEYEVFESEKLANLFEKAKNNDVRRVVTLTQMEAPTIRAFLDNEASWETLANETVDVVGAKNLDGVNLDIEYMPSDSHYRSRFSSFVSTFVRILNDKLEDPYITVSVIASSARDNKIYDISHLARETDGVFMMAYDFYYPGSEKIGPSAPLYGYNNGSGPFWYDVSTAVDDFLKVADSSKIILGVPYYGWNYPAYTPEPKTEKIVGTRGFSTTLEKMQDNKLTSVTPMGGWDDEAKVSWRGYWDEDGWKVAYMEDTTSLSYKFDFAKEKNLAGVGIWALGFDNPDSEFWSLLSEKFNNSKSLALFSD